ncbi:glycosyltransferase [Rothia sp. LK2492]|uniref:glycosyltransferase n=1 Tax=Rothia sp. LK2492 TaxID=3114370 RepID=UPI0034CDC510
MENQIRGHSVVIISSQVPKTEPTSAGERLVGELCEALSSHGHTPLVIAPHPRNGLAQQYAVAHHFLNMDKSSRIQKWRAPVGTWTPNLEFLLAVRNDSTVMKHLQSAEIIDMQWSTNIMLAPWLRRVNPSARLIGTYHDINEQRFKRRSAAETSAKKALVWSVQAEISRCFDTVSAGYLDTAIVLSAKDAGLLKTRQRDIGKVETILPPVYLGNSVPLARAARSKHLLFVGTMYRWENHQAVQWLIEKVLPLVWQKDPEVTLKVVGESPSADLLRLGQDPRIEFTGFLQEIEPAYAEATAVVAPIQLGSGVKFKTLDAILRAVPVIATVPGVEGIAQVSWASKIAHNPQGFARAILDVVGNPATYQAKADEACLEAKHIYSQQSYRARIGKIYGTNHS